MKLSDEQWSNFIDKLTTGQAVPEDKIKKMLDDLKYEYDDEDIEDIIEGMKFRKAVEGNVADDKHFPLTDDDMPILFDDEGQSIKDPRFDSTARFWFSTPEDAISNYGDENSEVIRKFYEEHPWEDDKPHEEDILLDGEESELEKKMTPEEFKIASNITGRSTGDFEPETPEDVQFMLEANKNGLKVSDERLKNVQSNSINSIANTLKNYRW